MESQIPWVQEVINYILEVVANWGYGGIFAMMFLESTLFPIPSELIVIPAGYLAYQGKMDMATIIFVGTLGSIGGALFNYILAVTLGRGFLVKFGRYIFFTEKMLSKVEEFFKSHGAISTFTGRLIIGVRHFISLPAGLARMNIPLFCFYTALGSALWVSVLAFLGYFIGDNEELVKKYLHIAIIVAVVGSVFLIGIYFWIHSKRSKKS